MVWVLLARRYERGKLCRRLKATCTDYIITMDDGAWALSRIQQVRTFGMASRYSRPPILAFGSWLVWSDPYTRLLVLAGPIQYVALFGSNPIRFNILYHACNVSGLLILFCLKLQYLRLPDFLNNRFKWSVAIKSYQFSFLNSNCIKIKIKKLVELILVLLC